MCEEVLIVLGKRGDPGLIVAVLDHLLIVVPDHIARDLRKVGILFEILNDLQSLRLKVVEFEDTEFHHQVHNRLLINRPVLGF